LILAYGHIFEIFTPNQLAETPGIDKNMVYEAIQFWSIYTFRKIYLTRGNTSKLILELMVMLEMSEYKFTIVKALDDHKVVSD